MVNSVRMKEGHLTCLRLHKWLVLLASVMVSYLIFGFIYVFGVLYLAMLDKFGESRTETATVQSLLVGLTATFAVIVGFIVSKIGLTIPSLVGAILAPLGLVLSFFAESILALDIYIGVVTALGISFIYISSVAALGKAFTGSKRLLFLALQNTAVSIAGISYPYFLQWLLTEYGFNGTLLILGGIFLNAIPAAIIFAGLETSKFRGIICCRKAVDLRDNVEASQKVEISFISWRKIDQQTMHGDDVSKSNGIQNAGFTDSDDKADCVSTQREARKDAGSKTEEVPIGKGQTGILSLPYLCLILGMTCIMSVLNGFLTVLLDISKWKGLSEEEGLFSFLPLQLGALFARLLPGLVKQKKGVNSLLLPVVFGVSGCIGQLVILFSESYAAILVGVILSGVSLGGVISAGSVAAVGIVGQQKFPIGFGLIQTAKGVMATGSGPLFGAIRDGTNSYQLVLIFSAAMMTIGIFFLLVCMYIRYRRLKSSVV